MKYLKNSINQKVCSLILSIVLSASILSCAFTFEKPPEPHKQVIEAGHFVTGIIVLFEWLKSIDWKKGGYHWRFPPKPE